jgi:hypothetical protein
MSNDAGDKCIMSYVTHGRRLLEEISAPMHVRKKEHLLFQGMT